MMRDFGDPKYRVIEVAFSTKKQIRNLQSDFKYVAKALVEYRNLYEKGSTDITKLKKILDVDMEFPYDVVNLLMEIFESTDFGKEIKKCLEEGGCKLLNYVERQKAQAVAQAFWENVYDSMQNGHFSEEAVLSFMDPKGEKQRLYPRPSDFPACFDKTA